MLVRVHTHLLIESITKLNRRKLAVYLKTYPKTVTYLEEVKSKEDVIYYTTKKIGKNALRYNYYTSKPFS